LIDPDGNQSYFGASFMANDQKTRGAIANAMATPVSSEVGHTVLDGVGLVPVIGEVADGANALWYGAEGDYLNAGLSAAATVPLFGWGAAGAKGISKLDKILAKGFIKEGEKFSAKAYRHNLQVFTEVLGKGDDAHHVFPKAKQFAEFFEKAGIDVHNPANMKWLKSTIHRGKNSASHLKEWTKVMGNYAERGIKPTEKLLRQEAKRIEKIFE
jgi:hypothetical protein